MEENLTCNLCGSPLELKHSAKGDFYGCTKWRETGCRGSRKIQQDGVVAPPRPAPQRQPSQFDLHAERIRMMGSLACHVYNTRYMQTGVEPATEDVAYAARMLADAVIRDCIQYPHQ